MNRNASRTVRCTTIFSLLLAMLLTACSSSGEKKTIDYKSSAPNKSANLEVPPDLVSPTRDDRFSLPAARSGSASLSTYSAERQQAGIRGTPEAAAGQQQSIGNMRIERAGSQRWLVAPGTPESVWPQLRSFWQETGLVLTTDSPQNRVMETDWAENRAKLPQDFVRRYLSAVVDPISDTNQRDRFRTRVEPSSTPGFVEIYVSHRGAEQIYNDQAATKLAWQPSPSDPELEVEMLRRIMQKLGANETSAKQVVAQAANAPAHAKLSNASDGTLLLTVEEPVDRAWRQVGLTLDRVGLVVEDRDRAKNTYYVRYVVTEDLKGKQDEGWFSKLAFWRGKKEPSTDQFRILVQPSGERTNVSVLNKDGVAVPSASARQMLTLLYNELK